MQLEQNNFIASLYNTGKFYFFKWKIDSVIYLQIFVTRNCGLQRGIYLSSAVQHPYFFFV